PRVTLAEHHRCGDGVLWGATQVRVSQYLGNACPEATCGAQLHDLTELVIGDGEAEGDLVQGLLGAQSSIHEGADVVDAGGQGQCDLLGVTGTLVGERDGVDKHGADVLPRAG